MALAMSQEPSGLLRDGLWYALSPSWEAALAEEVNQVVVRRL